MYHPFLLLAGVPSGQNVAASFGRMGRGVAIAVSGKRGEPFKHWLESPCVGSITFLQPAAVQRYRATAVQGTMWQRTVELSGSHVCLCDHASVGVEEE